ncbi:MAG: hypothetical protein LBG67_00045 [Campylobacteraceae bacterium]|nr:hypothetical protein [Campylobacteraceae bacterium]
MDSKEFQEKAGCVVKSMVDGKKSQSFVLGLVEFLLPFLFILSLIGCVIVAFKVTEIVSMFGGGWGGRDFQVGTFIYLTLGFIVLTLITFYFIYVLKAIKDSTSCICKSSSCCGEDVEEVKPKATKKSTASKEQE